MKTRDCEESQYNQKNKFYAQAKTHSRSHLLPPLLSVCFVLKWYFVRKADFRLSLPRKPSACSVSMMALRMMYQFQGGDVQAHLGVSSGVIIHEALSELYSGRPAVFPKTGTYCNKRVLYMGKWETCHVCQMEAGVPEREGLMTRD